MGYHPALFILHVGELTAIFWSIHLRLVASNFSTAFMSIEVITQGGRNFQQWNQMTKCLTPAPETCCPFRKHPRQPPRSFCFSASSLGASLEKRWGSHGNHPAVWSVKVTFVFLGGVWFSNSTDVFHVMVWICHLISMYIPSSASKPHFQKGRFIYAGAWFLEISQHLEVPNHGGTPGYHPNLVINGKPQWFRGTHNFRKPTFGDGRHQLM